MKKLKNRLIKHSIGIFKVFIQLTIVCIDENANFFCKMTYLFDLFIQ